MLQGRSGLQGQGSFEVMSLRSKLIRGHVFKVKTPSVACKAVIMLGGEDAGTGWLVWGLTALTYSLHAAREAISSRSGLFRGYIFIKVKVFKRLGFI